MKKEVENMFAAFLSWLGELTANVGTKASVAWYTDEPKMPKSLLNKQLKTQFVTEFFDLLYF